MKVGSADRRRVAGVADRYFADQCARLGPIEGALAPVRKRASGRTTVTKMDSLADPKTTSRPTFQAQRLGDHGGAETDVEMVDRFRL